MLFTFIIYKRFCDGTTGSKTTGKEVEGFGNPVFQSSKNEENFIKQSPGKLDSNKLKIQSYIYKDIQTPGNRMVLNSSPFVVVFMS